MNSPKTDFSDIPVLARGKLTLIGALNERLFQLLDAISSTGSIVRAAREVA